MITFWPRYLSSLGWAKVGSNMKKGRLKSWSLGGEGRGGLLEQTICLFQITFCLFFSLPFYYFHPDFKISLADLFLYRREPLKIITETIAAHLKAFWGTVWTTQQAKPQRAEALFQASKNGCCEMLWLLVQMDTLLSNSLHVQIPSVHCPALHASGFSGFESDIRF